MASTILIGFVDSVRDRLQLRGMEPLVLHQESLKWITSMREKDVNKYKHVYQTLNFTAVNNSSRGEGGTAVTGAFSSTDCLEFCGDDADCHSVDYNVITSECIKHDLDGSCRPLVTQADWYNYRLADCCKYLSSG